jgi:hypothetical protein
MLLVGKNIAVVIATAKNALLRSPKNLEMDLPSPKSTNRLPDRRNNSVCPQNRAGLKAAGRGSCAERRAEDARRHCGRVIGSSDLCIFCEIGASTKRPWCGGEAVV